MIPGGDYISNYTYSSISVGVSLCSASIASAHPLIRLHSPMLPSMEWALHSSWLAQAIFLVTASTELPTTTPISGARCGLLLLWWLWLVDPFVRLVGAEFSLDGGGFAGCLVLVEFDDDCLDRAAAVEWFCSWTWEAAACWLRAVETTNRQ